MYYVRVRGRLYLYVVQSLRAKLFRKRHRFGPIFTVMLRIAITVQRFMHAQEHTQQYHLTPSGRSSNQSAWPTRLRLDTVLYTVERQTRRPRVRRGLSNGTRTTKP